VYSGGLGAGIGASIFGSLWTAGAASTVIGGALVGAGIAIAGTGALAAATAMKSSYSKGTGNYTDNNVRITRGAYGAYLGLTKAKELKPNTLINIYAPGYLSQSS